jgi:diguanylate cyclase
MNLKEPPAALRLSDAEIARRALKLLADRKIVPTPQSFTQACAEVSGMRSGAATPIAVLKDVLRDLVRAGRLSASELSPLVEAAQAYNWDAVREGVDRALARRSGGSTQNWPKTAVALLKQADQLHAQWTRARKLDAVTRVVEAAADQPDVALERLQKLMESWGPVLPALPGARDAASGPATGGPATVNGATALAAALPLSTAAAQAAIGTPPLPVAQRYGSDPDLQASRDRAKAEADAWKQVSMRACQLLAAACGNGTPAALKIADYVKGQLKRDAVGAESEAADRIAPRFIDLVAGIERQLAEEQKVRIGLQRLLALLCDNIKTLSPDEVWLAGQLEPIRALLAGPLAASSLEQAEVRLAQIIASQGSARRSLQEAKVALKEMLSTLIERIGSMSSSTGAFYEQIGGYQRELEGATDFETLSRVIKGLLADTAVVRTDIEKSRTDLAEARRKVEAYEARVTELERELTQVSSLVQKDPLTFALNRRGLEEAFRVETARAARYGAPLALAVLDVDDFKKLNDTLGHVAGDRALVHLATTLQSTLRPTDIIARLGGEEFALLLPATDLAEASDAGERLRKELAGRPFQWDGAPRTITFSAGVAEWREGEPIEDLIQRADGAMYQAKRAGKNRVVKAA